MRTVEMFIACINDKPRGVHFDESALSAFDEEYHDLTISQLENAVKNKSFDNINISKSKVDINIVDVENIKNMLKDRVKVF